MSPASSPASAGSFDDLPFSLELGDGWVFGSVESMATRLATLERTNPDYAKKLKVLLDSAPTFTSEFVAYDVGSADDFTPNVSCNTLDRGDASIAAALAQGEKQNVEALAQLPDIVGRPTSDRISLPVGETVRVRWRWTGPSDETDATSIGYLFVSGPTVYTCVFSAGTSTIATHEPEWEAILRTFTATAVASPSASATGSVVDSHDAPAVEALLPKSVAGRRLTIWSVQGAAVLKLWGASAEQISTTRTQLASMGVRLDDVVQATAGRSYAEDPPYFVFAFRIPADARDLLGGYAIASIGFIRETDDWQLEDRVIGGKTVGVGSPDLLVQSEHQRGRPYLYGSEALDTSFIVITDDEAWAEEAIRQLPS